MHLVPHLKEQDLRGQMQRNIRLLYLLRVVSSMFFSVLILVLFWQENGLSLTNIMLLQTIFAIATLISNTI